MPRQITIADHHIKDAHLYRRAYALMRVNGPMDACDLMHALGLKRRSDIANKLINFEALGLLIWEGDGYYGAL